MVGPKSVTKPVASTTTTTKVAKTPLSKFEKNRIFPVAKPTEKKSTSSKSKKSVATVIVKSPIETIKELEQQVISSTEHSNKILEIIKICKSNIKELEIVFQSIKSLEKIFIHLFDSNNTVVCQEFKILKQLSYNSNNGKLGATTTKSKDQFIIYIHWLYKIYVVYLDLLKELLVHEDPSIQLPTLTTLLNILKRESILLSLVPTELLNGESNKEIPGSTIGSKDHYTSLSKQEFKSLISTMMLSNNFNTKLLDHFTELYIGKYQDLFYYSLWSINDIASSMIALCKKNDGKEFQEQHGLSVGKFIENLFDFLCYFEPITVVPEKWEFWVGEPNFSVINENGASLKLKMKHQAIKFIKPSSIDDKEFDKHSTGWNTLTKCSSYKSVFSKAWISFLTLPLPPTIYKHVLLGLPERVFPHLTDARVLLDFFTNSYDLGGVTSILALNGVFILITRYNLEYPDFFKKLYSLFQPGVLYAKYRARFFKLADLFLSSKTLPNYLIAAFIKRCATLCLISPPYGSLILLPLIYNLLQRNVNCHSLINNPIKQTLNEQQKQQLQQQQKAAISSSVLLIKPTKLDGDITLSNDLMVNGLYGSDPYLPLEEDPSKCNAINSSLWEISILRDHYSPEVSKMAKLFDTGLKNIIDLNEFSFVTYQVMYENSYKKKSATVPLSFTQKSSLIEPEIDFMSNWKF